MLHANKRQRAKRSLLLDYGTRLGNIVERRKTEAALVAARRQAEAAASEAQAAQTEAQSANRAKTDFLANMSHELRTPLNAIIGFSEAMLSTFLKQGKLEKCMEYTRDINASGVHLLELINDLLDLAKIEARRLELNEDEVDPVEVAESSLRVVRQRASDRGVRMETDFPRPLPQLRADERKLKQIFINLLANAVKFTPAGGTVTFRIAKEEGGGLAFVVADTGIGIAEADIPRVLEPFVQVDSQLARASDGTGLGLPLASALVKLHGGALEIASAVGSGTTVTVRLPSERVLPL